MKKFFCIAVVMAFSAMTMSAQSVMQTFTQARALDVVANAHVKPLVAELKVDATKPIKKELPPLSKVEVASFNGDIDNIRAYAVYKTQMMLQEEDHIRCDILVAPTFNIVNTANQCYVTVTGFVGVYDKFYTMTESDLKWLEHEAIMTTSDRSKIEAVVKPVITK